MSTEDLRFDGPPRENRNAPFRYDEHHLMPNGDPVVFLQEFLKMSRLRSRGQIAFDHKDLAWIAKAWGEAASAAIGDTRVRDACIHERDRYNKLCHELKAGELERGESGAMFLDSPSDWPAQPVIRRAIHALLCAGIAIVH